MIELEEINSLNPTHKVQDYKMGRYIKYESPFFSIFPKIWFEIRDTFFKPFHFTIFRNISVGLLLIHFILLCFVVIYVAVTYQYVILEVAE